LALVGLAEVADEMTMAAADAAGVAFDVPEQLPGALGQFPVALEHEPPLHEVGGRVDEHALRLETIASGAAGLLLIVLERLRRAGMHDEANVRPVDSHPERHR